MLNSVKGLLATIFSVALILSQAAFMLGAQETGYHKAAVPKCCVHCEMCKGRCCCAGKNDSTPNQPSPAVPSHSLSQIDWQFLPALVIDVSANAKPDSLPLFSLTFCYPSVAAPLYQRNCSYII